MKNPLFQDARFLIVDDNPQNITLLTHLLEQWDANSIVSTTRPQEAQELFRAFRPDMVLLDLMMPEMDGMKVMDLIRAHIPRGDFVPILMLTADNSDEAKRRALMRGATDFLTKPFDTIELSLRIHNLLKQRTMHRLLQDQNVSLDRQVQERTEQLAQAEIDTAECLAMAGEYRDDDTGQHTQRVGNTAADVATKLGMNEAEVEMMRRAAPLHDVGKIGIPDSILLKPGKLTGEEFAIIKTHTTIGSAILARHGTTLLRSAASIAISHHERWDGNGYPNRLAGEDIPLSGRIVAVVDVFDALTHDRPYKTKWPLKDAMEEIQRQSGSQFDPGVVAAFTELVLEGSLALAS